MERKMAPVACAVALAAATVLFFVPAGAQDRDGSRGGGEVHDGERGDDRGGLRVRDRERGDDRGGFRTRDRSRDGSRDRDELRHRDRSRGRDDFRGRDRVRRRVGGGFGFWFGPGWDPWWWERRWVSGPSYGYPYRSYPAPPAYGWPVPPPGQEPPSWYYCQDPPGYYPAVAQCPGGWVRVVPGAGATAPPAAAPAAPAPPAAEPREPGGQAPARSVPEEYRWYYCDDPEGYYPYVRDCPKGWTEVQPVPPPSPSPAP